MHKEIARMVKFEIWFEVPGFKLTGMKLEQVETFCVHGSPTGYITGIRGRVQCVTDAELSKLKISEFERMQMIRQKCFLRFPNLPFIPRQPYNVIATDYDNYALVSGAKDASFIQVHTLGGTAFSSITVSLSI